MMKKSSRITFRIGRHIMYQKESIHLENHQQDNKVNKFQICWSQNCYFRYLQVPRSQQRGNMAQMGRSSLKEVSKGEVTIFNLYVCLSVCTIVVRDLFYYIWEFSRKVDIELDIFIPQQYTIMYPTFLYTTSQVIQNLDFHSGNILD